MSEVPFPQADKLEKVLLLIRNVKSRSEPDLMSLLDLGTKRQYQYYFSAAIFLGFLTNSGNKTELTESGTKVLQESNEFYKERFILELLKNKLIKAVVFNYKEKTILEVLEKFNGFKDLSHLTKKRRTETVKRWVEWLNKNI